MDAHEAVVAALKSWPYIDISVVGGHYDEDYEELATIVLDGLVAAGFTVTR